MSGVKLTEACMTSYTDIQKGKKHRYTIFLIKDGQIDVEKVGDRNNGYNDFLNDLHQMDGDGAESTFKSKMFLMSWCPDSSRIKKKMLYSSSFDTVKRAFVGVHKVIQANDKSDCAQDVVEDILRATDRN